MGKGWHIITEADIKKYEKSFDIKEKKSEQEVTVSEVKQVRLIEIMPSVHLIKKYINHHPCYFFHFN